MASTPTAPASCVLACNAGSSSLKLSLFVHDGAGGGRRLLRASVTLPAGDRSFAELLREWLLPYPVPDVVLHRVVHAGLVPEQARRLDQQSINCIRHWLPLAPRHNTLTLELIDAVSEQFPALAQYAIYDSGPYASLPAVAARYALSPALSPQWPLRRYGFHGLAHRNQWRQVQALMAAEDRRSTRRLISIHLGSGASVTAWLDGQAIDTSMGFSPLEGLIMARRSGSIDPGILTHLLLREGMDAQTLETQLHQRSGLQALVGHDGDMRTIVAEADRLGERSAAAMAIDMYCYQVRKTVGAFMAALGGVDAISLGGGVAEHQPRVRAKIFEGMQNLGMTVDPTSNQSRQGAGAIHAADSRCALYLTPVNEMDEMLRQYEAIAITPDQQ